MRFMDGCKLRGSISAGIKKASMTKKWIAINLLLLTMAALLGWRLRLSIVQFGAENNLSKIQPAADLKKTMLQEKLVLKPIPVRNYNPAEFAVIPEKNLFTDSRSKEEKVENLVPPEPPPLAQKPILIGVTITDKERTASIIDPAAQPSPNERGRRGQFKKIGDVYQGYTITEILPDRIVLESGTRKEVIPLREGSKRPQGGKTPILSTRIVPFGAGGASGGTIVNVAGSTPGAAPQRTAVAPIGSPAGSQPATVIQTAPPARSTAGQPAAQQAQPAAQPSPAGDYSGPTRIIKTPFGDIVRPAR
jgi:hypothetical protein